MIPFRYCRRGHWDDPQLPINIRRRTIVDVQRDAEILRRRFESLKFCLTCGSELLLACEECKAPIQDGPDGEPPQHCGACGNQHPWAAKETVASEEAELVTDAESDGAAASRIISAPVGRVKAFKSWANKVFVKVAPSAGKVLSKVATDYVEKKIGL